MAICAGLWAPVLMKTKVTIIRVMKVIALIKSRQPAYSTTLKATKKN
jgi:hypothetical protein